MAVTEFQRFLRAELDHALDIPVLAEELPTPWRWAEENVTLQRRASNLDGPYDSGVTPYAREWHEAFADRKVKQVAICAGGQIGKTETILNCIRYAIAIDPGPMLMVMPSGTLARWTSENRIQPSLRDCPATASEILADQDKFKLLDMHLARCTFTMVGANSPGQLSSRPIRYLFGDELDKWPPLNTGTREAGALELAKIRTRTFWNRSIFLVSTPTVETGQIWRLYMDGDQRRYHVPCPVCGYSQALQWKRVKWSEDARVSGGWDMDLVQQSTRYHCEQCDHHIEDSAKAEMLAAGEWRALGQCPPDRRSYHLSALYSPWMSWADAAVEFLESKHDVSRVQAFVNSVLAEPYIVDGRRTNTKQLRQFCRDYTRGSLPEDVEILSLRLTADVQRDSVYWVLGGFDADLNLWVLDWSEIPKVWPDVQALMEMEVGGKSPTRGLIDSGYDSQSVYELCLASRRKWFPVKGLDRMQQTIKTGMVPVFSGKQTPAKLRRRGKGGPMIDLIRYSDFALKTDLYSMRLHAATEPLVLFPEGVDNDFLSHLTVTTLREEPDSKGRKKQWWETPGGADDHYSDCLKLFVIHRLYLQRSRKK